MWWWWHWKVHSLIQVNKILQLCSPLPSSRLYSGGQASSSLVAAPLIFFFFQGFLSPALPKPKAFQGFPQIRPWSLALETHTQFVNTWKFGHLELGLILIFWSPFSFGLVVLPVSQMAINFGFLVVFYVSFIPLRLDSSLILPALNSKMWHLGLNYSQCLKSIFSLVGIDIGVDTR